MIDGIRHGVGEDDVRRIPELETPVRLATEWLVLHGRQYGKGLGHQPKLNDAMDFESLFALGLPAILCSSDRKFVDRVRALRTPGSQRVVSPAELLAHLSGEVRVC